MATAAEPANALPNGYALNEYRIESVLGAGGFGLTYLATDANLNLKVALKEYLPGEFASRNPDSSVQPMGGPAGETFQWGLQRFLDEARTLASFRHSNIVRVMRFFEANCTGYMVMEFVDGKPLSNWISARRPLSRQPLLRIIEPLLDGLEVIHNAGYLHRDIKPANIYIRGDGSPVLLDFGSARHLMSGDQELTAIVTPGYAPLEQYHTHGKQGPWSDLYSFGGVLYWMVTGTKPVEAAARVHEDTLVPAARAGFAGVHGPELLMAIDWALKPREAERPQNVAEFRRALAGEPPAGAFDRTVPASAASRTVASQTQAPSGPSGVVFDAGLMKWLETELAKHIGPISAMVVKGAAKKAASIDALCRAVATEISDEKEQAAFIKRFTASERSGRLTGPTGPVPVGVTREAPLSGKIPDETLRQAEISLAQHIGAIAKLVVKRAAAKARDEAELYLLISDEIKDINERKAFIRKAISASRKR
jgi:serine/threonine protein kinase